VERRRGKAIATHAADGFGIESAPVLEAIEDRRIGVGGLQQLDQQLDRQLADRARAGVDAFDDPHQRLDFRLYGAQIDEVIIGHGRPRSIGVAGWSVFDYLKKCP
jgi:hypothetical protein